MHRLLPGFIIGIFCCVVICLAGWAGTCYWKDGGDIGPDRLVRALGGPGNPQVETGNNGEYMLGPWQGMQNGEYYTVIKATKQREGETWVGIKEMYQTYWDSVPIWNLNITLCPPEEHPGK